jgi:hypothetical protein
MTLRGPSRQAEAPADTRRKTKIQDSTLRRQRHAAFERINKNITK